MGSDPTNPTLPQVSNLAFGYLLTVGVFFARATLMMWLRPGFRFILSAPMRMMPVDTSVPDTGEPPFEGIVGGVWSPGVVFVLAPAPDAVIVFGSRNTVVAALLGGARAEALWRLFKATGRWLLAAQMVGGMLGGCMLFDLSVNWVSGAVVVVFTVPNTLLCCAFMNVDLFMRLSSRFETLFLVHSTLSFTFGTAATFTWSDPRCLVALAYGLICALPLCFLDSWCVPLGGRVPPSVPGAGFAGCVARAVRLLALLVYAIGVLAVSA